MDSLFCGKATPVATVHRTVAKSRLSSPLSEPKKNPHPNGWSSDVMGFHRSYCVALFFAVLIEEISSFFTSMHCSRIAFSLQ